ncbi:peptidoglycan recognition protein family protein, partial [Bacillus pumilus]
MARVQFKQRESTDAIFVHCSATKPSQNVGVREIRQWHKEQGWLDVGYHFIIKRDGTVEAGRDEMAVGSHAKGYNHNSIGVCLVGGIDDKGKFDANFTPAQM